MNWFKLKQENRELKEKIKQLCQHKVWKYYTHDGIYYKVCDDCGQKIFLSFSEFTIDIAAAKYRESLGRLKAAREKVEKCEKEVARNKAEVATRWDNYMASGSDEIINKPDFL